MSNVVREKLEAYFASLNSTSGRMMADIVSSREEYIEKWDNMSADEQSEVLWKSIVKPDAITKYENEPTKTLDVEYFPVLRTRPGEKIIVEEDSASAKSFVSGSTWQDEHSAPFRWETQSQLDIRIHDDDNCTDTEKNKTLQREVPKLPKSIEIVDFKKDCLGISQLDIRIRDEDDGTDTEKNKTLQREAPKLPESEKHESKKEDEVKRQTIKRPEVPPPPVPPHAVPPVPVHCESPPVPPHIEKAEKAETPIYAKVVKRKSSAKTLVISEMKAHRKAKEEMKPAVPPRMSLELKGNVDYSKFKVQDIDIDGIPKTGFDFLDNW